jgi:ABC-type antimicrobial peptide transport system permease subunit
LNIRASFPSREYLAATLALDQPSGEDVAALEGRRAQMFDALSRRLAQEPGVMAVAYADRVPGRVAPEQRVRVEPFGNTSAPYDGSFRTVAIGPGYLDVLGRPAIAGRAFQAGDWNPAARTVVVNEAFARDFAGRAGGRRAPLGARLMYSEGSYEIVGVVRNLGLDPDDSGNEAPFVFRPTPAGGLSSLAIIVHLRGDPAPLAARFPALVASIDARVLVRSAEPLDASIRQRDTSLATEAGAFAAVTFLVLFLSALGIFSLVSVNVSRRTREIGVRTALGASARQVLTGIVSRGVLLMGGGIATGGVLLLTAIAFGAGPSGRPDDDLPPFIAYLAITAAVMMSACLLACVAPAGRALRVNPTEALRDS